MFHQHLICSYAFMRSYVTGFNIILSGFSQFQPLRKSLELVPYKFVLKPKVFPSVNAGILWITYKRLFYFTETHSEQPACWDLDCTFFIRKTHLILIENKIATEQCSLYQPAFQFPQIHFYHVGFSNSLFFYISLPSLHYQTLPSLLLMTLIFLFFCFFSFFSLSFIYFLISPFYFRSQASDKSAWRMTTYFSVSWIWQLWDQVLGYKLIMINLSIDL